MTNEELVKALRCPDFGDVPCSNHDCKYWGPYACKARVVITDAAAAIEELEKERDYYKQQYENRQRLIKSALGEEWT